MVESNSRILSLLFFLEPLLKGLFIVDGAFFSFNSFLSLYKFNLLVQLIKGNFSYFVSQCFLQDGVHEGNVGIPLEIDSHVFVDYQV